MIKWGNGITPTGGQVLVQGITSAASVATDPNVLNALTGTRDAEPAHDDTELRNAIAKLRQNNQSIRSELNSKVLAPWGIEPTKFESAFTATDAGDGGSGGVGSGGHVSILQLRDELDFTASELDKATQSIPPLVPQTVALGEHLRDRLQLSGAELQALDAAISFASRVRKTLEVDTQAADMLNRAIDAMKAKAANDTAENVVAQYEQRLKELALAASDANAAATKMLEQSKQMSELSDLPTVKRSLETATRSAKGIGSWAPIPESTDELLNALRAAAKQADSGDENADSF
jgi:hypothetical protein